MRETSGKISLSVTVIHRLVLNEYPSKIWRCFVKVAGSFSVLIRIEKEEDE